MAIVPAHVRSSRTLKETTHHDSSLVSATAMHFNERPSTRTQGIPQPLNGMSSRGTRSSFKLRSHWRIASMVIGSPWR